MRRRPSIILRGVLKFLTVAVAAAAVGAGIGVGLGSLRGDSSPAGTPMTGSDSKQTETTSQTTPTTKTQTTPDRKDRTPSVRVVKAVLFPAATQRGRALQRARVSVRVRVTNRGSEPLDPGKPRLIVDDERVGVDPRAVKIAGDVLKSIPPGKSETGELRFETSGALTQRLKDKPSARLRIAGRIASVDIAISSTPAVSDSEP